MLPIIKHYLENPEDIPSIPPKSAEYLKVRLNPAYLMRTGALDDFRKTHGFSEAATLGFLEGVAAAVEIVEQMEDPTHIHD